MNRENPGPENATVRKSHAPKFTEGLLDNGLVLNALGVKTGQTVLDAGCGTGYMAKLFSVAVGKTGRVYALDPDRHFIDPLEAETRGTNILAIRADITKPTPIPESDVDIIYISTVLHSFSREKIGGFVAEAKRILKPGAILAVVEIEKRQTPFGPPLHQRYSPEELESVIPLVPLGTVQVGEHFYMLIFKKPPGENSPV